MELESIKTVFVYDEDGFFEDTHIAQPNPRNPGAWLFPPRATTVKPAMEEKVFYKIQDPTSQDSQWEAIPYPSCAEDFIGVEIPHQSRTKRNEVLRAWLRKFVADAPKLWKEKQINDKAGNLQAITIEAIPQPTAEELLEQKAQSVRAQRDALLNKTDYLVQPDYPITAKQLAAVKTYRQALRDVPEQDGFPENVIWPEMPDLSNKSEEASTTEETSTKSSE